ncbi:hypothetical protein FKM82_027064 [Ascaphus truei]
MPNFVLNPPTKYAYTSRVIIFCAWGCYIVTLSTKAVLEECVWGGVCGGIGSLQVQDWLTSNVPGKQDGYQPSTVRKELTGRKKMGIAT